MYLRFMARIQYLCKHGSSIPLKEYAITLHIIHIMPHIISRWKALIKDILNAAYMALVHPQFLLCMDDTFSHFEVTQKED